MNDEEKERASAIEEAVRLGYAYADGFNVQYRNDGTTRITPRAAGAELIMSHENWNRLRSTEFGRPRTASMAETPEAVPCILGGAYHWRINESGFEEIRSVDPRTGWIAVRDRDQATAGGWTLHASQRPHFVDPLALGLLQQVLAEHADLDDELLPFDMAEKIRQFLRGACAVATPSYEVGSGGPVK